MLVSVAPLGSIDESNRIAPLPIPVVSLASIDTASAQHLASIACTLDAAFSNFGFVILSNVTVLSSPAALLSSARSFFGRSHEEKMLHNFGDYGNGKGGFTPMGQESASATLETLEGEQQEQVKRTGKDRVENYAFRSMHGDDGDDGDAGLHPPELYGEAKPYFDDMSELLRLLNRLTAMAVGVDDEFFQKFFWDEEGRDNNNYNNFAASPANGNSLKIAHYPAVGAEKGEGEEECEQTDEGAGSGTRMPDGSLRYGAHTDCQTFTILLQDPTDHKDGFGGLEVFVSGAWVPVVPPAVECTVAGTHSFVVNCGDLTEIWTNGRWKSVLHRVSNPTSEEGWGHARISVPFFTGPKDDVLVEPIEGAFEGAGGGGKGEGCEGGIKSRYKAVNAKDHLTMKLSLLNA